jgi:Fe-S cluster assembly protein SufB
VYNLVTKRARTEAHAIMEWVDCNLGSKVTMKYPSVYLAGEGSRGEVLSIAYASDGQHQDAGAKMIHLAPHTSSRIISKSVSRKSGRTSYRGLVTVTPDAHNSNVFVSCDALLLDEEARSDTYPYMKINNSDVHIQHEATVEKIGEEKLFYLMSRGISRTEAEGMLVNGFIDPITKEIPLEYSIELNRLINLEMSGSVG